jgi:hypothetical protein
MDQNPHLGRIMSRARAITSSTSVPVDTSHSSAHPFLDPIATGIIATYPIMGFLGIREDHKLPHVPATVVLNESTGTSHAATAGLKHGTGKSSHIVLVPQPSEDPNDPLNWSSAKKLTVVLIIAFRGCLYAATFGPLLNVSLVILAV